MRLTCDREKLQNAFQTASMVAPTRSPKPILQNVKLEAAGSQATLLATDLESAIRVDVPGIEAEAPGEVVLPIGRFGSILRESNDAAIRLESDGSNVVIRGDHSEFRLPAENPAEFPAVVEFKESKYHEAPARLLLQMIRRTAFATDNESSRYALGGVLLEFHEDRLIAVGTDGRRLAKMEGPAQSVAGHKSGEQMTIVPTRAMHLLERAINDADAEVQIAARGNDVLVKTPRVTIYSRLVEGRFPKWRDVFPTRPDAEKIDLVVGQLHTAVRQAAIVTSEESRGVDFTFQDGLLVLSGQAAEHGQSRVELPIAYQGREITIKLDPKYVAEFLKVLDPDKTFTLDIKDSDSAAVCSTDDGYGYVIMPLAKDR